MLRRLRAGRDSRRSQHPSCRGADRPWGGLRQTHASVDARARGRVAAHFSRPAGVAGGDDVCRSDGGRPGRVFRYCTSKGEPSYEKFRLIVEKKFWRTPAGKPALLYGLETLAGASPDLVLVVEGELDAHAIRAAGLGPVVSVPDGSDSRLSPELLAPLAPFNTVVLATDADEPGDRLAERLAVSLGRERCRRLWWPEAAGKDANDALRAGWGPAELRSAIDSATPMEGMPAASGGSGLGSTSRIA